MAWCWSLVQSPIIERRSNNKKATHSKGRGLKSKRGEESNLLSIREVGVRLIHAFTALVFLADFLDQAAGHKVLQLFISAQTEHFLSTRDSVAQFQFLKGAFEELIERENFIFHKDADELIGNMVRKAA